VIMLRSDIIGDLLEGVARCIKNVSVAERILLFKVLCCGLLLLSPSDTKLNIREYS